MNDNPPAFPLVVPTDFQLANNGMSLRDWFAGQASEEDIGAHLFENGNDWAERPRAREQARYAFADAMLAARAAPTEAVSATPTDLSADEREIARCKAAGIFNIVNGNCTTCEKSQADCDCLPF